MKLFEKPQVVEFELLTTFAVFETSTILVDFYRVGACLEQSIIPDSCQEMVALESAYNLPGTL